MGSPRRSGRVPAIACGHCRLWFRDAPCRAHYGRQLQENANEQRVNILNYFASKPEGAELHTDPASNRSQDAQPLSHLSDEIDSDVVYTECEDEEEVQVVQQHQAAQVPPVYSHFAEDQDELHLCKVVVKLDHCMPTMLAVHMCG